MTSDLDLLRQFVHDNSQDAFREIVRRHLDLVYSAALRQVHSPQLAEEISQSVFGDLARTAEKLKPETNLTAWLYAVTRRTAIDAIRKESRRQLREQIAAEMQNMNATENSWTQIEPFLDEAMDSLDETDRAAILLRYFENKNLREVGDALKISDDAAQKRVSRAVEKLREFFSKRKITIGASGLAILISANAVQSAPVGLALTIANASLAAAGTTLTFMKIVTATKLKLAFSAIVVAGVVTAFVVQQQNQTKLRVENESFQQQIAQLQSNNADLSNRLAQIGEAKKLSDEQFNELLKLRGETGVLRRQLGEATDKNRAWQHAAMAMNTNSSAPQIHIKARFFSMPKDVMNSLGFQTSVVGSPGYGTLTSESVSNTLSELQSRDGVKELGEPEVVTTSERQTEMRVTQNITIITGFTFEQTNNTSSMIPQTEVVETGPVLDVKPRILSDGYTIELPVIASVTDFWGYEQPTNATTPIYTTAGEKVDVPNVSPQFRKQQTQTSANLLDNQTLVLALNDVKVLPPDAVLLNADGSAVKHEDTQTLVFITATIVDAAGNRVHDDENSANGQ